MKNEDLIIITSHCDTKAKLDVLRNLVNQVSLQKNKFDLMVISHTTIPQDIAEKTNMSIFDQKNELLFDLDLRNKSWFSPNDEKPILSVFTGFYNTHLAIWRMLTLANSIAKNCGYKKAHHLEYDCDIKDFFELYDNSKLLDTYDSVTYNVVGGTVDDILFGTFQSYRLDTLHEELFKLDEEKLKDKIRNLDLKSPEKMTSDLLHEGKRVKIKLKSDLDKNNNVFGMSHGVLSNMNTAWCLPYFNRENEKLEFVVWNMEKRGNINVLVIYNDDKIFTFENIKPSHWKTIEIDYYSNAKKMIVILNNKIRDIFDFDKDREDFKKNSFK
jgi:hypothetical protein